jgi:hypothetical protein
MTKLRPCVTSKIYTRCDALVHVVHVLKGIEHELAAQNPQQFLIFSYCKGLVKAPIIIVAVSIIRVSGGTSIRPKAITDAIGLDKQLNLGELAVRESYAFI